MTVQNRSRKSGIYLQLSLYGIGPDTKAEKASQAVHVILQRRCHRGSDISHRSRCSTNTIGFFLCVIGLNIAAVCLSTIDFDCGLTESLNMIFIQHNFNFAFCNIASYFKNCLVHLLVCSPTSISRQQKELLEIRWCQNN